jgi:hypothetical protein
MCSSIPEAFEIAADSLGATDLRRRPDPGSWLSAGPHHGGLSLSRTSTSAARKISDPAGACMGHAETKTTKRYAKLDTAGLVDVLRPK